MKNLIKGVCVAAAVGAAAGCLTTVDSVENADTVFVANEVLRKHVETDASSPVKVNNLRDATAANGFLRISVEFINTSSSQAMAFYQCEWFDENGMTVPSSTKQWTQILLQGRDTRWINFTAPNVRAKDYKIRVIEKLN